MRVAQHPVLCYMYTVYESKQKGGEWKMLHFLNESLNFSNFLNKRGRKNDVKKNVALQEIFDSKTYLGEATFFDFPKSKIQAWG